MQIALIMTAVLLARCSSYLLNVADWAIFVTFMTGAPHRVCEDRVITMVKNKDSQAFVLFKAL